MKKLFVILVAMLCFGISANADERSVQGRPVDAKLCYSDQRLELYSDGRCKVIVGGTNSGWGSYTLNPGRTKITIKWENGEEHRGEITVYANGAVGALVVEGVRYSPCR